MANRSSRSRFPLAVRSGQRRETKWLSVSPGLATLTATGGTLLAVLSAGAKAFRPFTVMRTHILLQVTSDQIVATEDQVGAYGLAVVSDEASAAGVASIPTPISNASSDKWFVYQMFFNSWAVSSAIGAVNRSGGQVYQIDSKAMRKVDVGEDIVFVAEFDATGEGFRIIDGGRILIKLH